MAMPGVVFSHAGLSTSIRMTRGAGIGRFANGCAPNIFLDGTKVTSDTEMTFDDIVRPAEVLGVEVYPGFAGAPAFALGRRHLVRHDHRLYSPPHLIASRGTCPGGSAIVTAARATIR